MRRAIAGASSHWRCVETLEVRRAIVCASRPPWRSGLGRRIHFAKFDSQHLSGAGSSPAGSVGRDLNLQKLNYQCLTTSVVVVLVVR